MKKIFLTTILLYAGIVGAFAQTIEIIEVEKRGPLSKNGHEILPKQGDFGLSISVNPFLEYLGGIFSDADAKAPEFFNDLGLSGQYFLTDNTSIRATLNLNFGSNVSKGTVRNDFAFQQDGEYNGQTVIDVRKRNTNNVDLAAGYVFHRGYHRLQAFYGGEVGIGFGSSKYKYLYANEMTEINPAPTTSSDFNGGSFNPDVRTLEQKDGTTLSFKVGGFVGVEYFIAPKMSIGGEFGLGLKLSNRWQGETTTEEWNVPQNQIVEKTVRSLNGRTGEIRFSTVTKGQLMLTLYF